MGTTHSSTPFLISTKKQIFIIYNFFPFYICLQPIKSTQTNVDRKACRKWVWCKKRAIGKMFDPLYIRMKKKMPDKYSPATIGLSLNTTATPENLRQTKTNLHNVIEQLCHSTDNWRIISEQKLNDRIKKYRLWKDLLNARKWSNHGISLVPKLKGSDLLNFLKIER